MSTRTPLIGLGIGLMFLPIQGFGQALQNFNTSINVQSNIAFQSYTNLSFGTLQETGGGSAGSVTITPGQSLPSNLISSSVGATTYASAIGTFTLSGTPGNNYLLTFPNTTVTALSLNPSLTGNTTKLTLNHFTVLIDSGSLINVGTAQIPGALGASGSTSPLPGQSNVSFGATLNYPASIVADQYSVSFAVTAAYN